MLASQKSRATQLARTLKINNLSPSLDPPPTRRYDSSMNEYLGSAISSLNKWAGATLTNPSPTTTIAIMKRCLRSAISSLKNLDRVVWAVSSSDPWWTQTAVIDALAGLSHLQDFRLSLSGGVFPLLQLDRLSGLKKISLSGSCADYRSLIIGGLSEAIAKSPELVYLEVDTTRFHASQETPMLHDLFCKVPKSTPLRLTHLVLHGVCASVDSLTLPHLRSLICLNLSTIFAPPPTDDSESLGDGPQGQSSTISEIYAMLKQEKIRLKQAFVSGPSVNDAILDYLHSYSGLESLDLYRICSYSEEESNALSHRFFKFVLPKHVDSIQVLKIQPTYEGGWCYNADDISLLLAKCNKLRSLSVALASHYYNGNIDDMISSLVNLSLILPCLNIISVFPADLEAHRFSICGNPSMEYTDYVLENIARSVAKFTLGEEKCSRRALPDIWVGRDRLYQYQKLDDELRWGYKLSYTMPWTD